ncbi:hypothetical protein B0H10DRAFT_1966618 [Mycena sp. CBHHK59/15]|nr:hypothetical protein B0H10DRAFT_1966618 [Mycena sp. CBHHK59/15]
MRIASILFSLGVAQLALASSSRIPDHVYHIPSALQNTSSQAQFISSSTGPDAPKVHPINGSAFDWWYFDVVSTDSLASVVVVFYTTSAAAFPFLGPLNSAVVAQISGSFANGTLFTAMVEGDAATVEVKENSGTSGAWHGTGFTWMFDPASGYSISIDAPEIGVVGTISFKSAAPAHYPCGPVAVGQNLEVGPNIGWANAIPDAVSAVHLTVNGTKLAFTGAGYHDKNWSDQIFQQNVASWYWGHGRVGAYSIVWFDFLALNGTEYVSAYVAKGGKIVAASCEATSIRVRPTGQNATYPPVISTGNPSGYNISLALSEHWALELNVSVVLQVASTPGPVYTRSLGTISGSVVPVGGGVAKESMTGVALFEQFKLTV